MEKGISALLIASLAGCAADDPTTDITPPELEVLAPERSTIAAGASVEVRGLAMDDGSGVASVTVNGQEAALSEDGSFAITLEVDDGITLLETVALDRAGNRAADARAVLAGTLVDHQTPVSQGVVAHLSSEAMGGLGVVVGELAGGVDWTALAQTHNPVADSGDGCNSYKVYATSIQERGFLTGARAESGGIRLDVSVRDLVVHGHVDWRAVCASGRSHFVMSADFYDVGASVRPRLSGSQVRVDVANLASSFRGFKLDVNGLPGFIENQIEGYVRDRVAAILRDRIRELVPPAANDFLAEFVSDSWVANILDLRLRLSIQPTSMSWTDQGGRIVLDTGAYAEGVDGAVYLSSPRPAPGEAAMGASALGIAMADDVLNQVLVGIWASGALQEAVLPDQGDALSIAIGAEVSRASATLLLPPVASFDGAGGAARLTVGDLLVEATGEDGGSLARFVVSAEIELEGESAADGRLRIVTRTPRILAQVLEQSPTLIRELDDERVAAIAELAIRQVAHQADRLLETLPVPGLAGASIGSPSFRPETGYLLMGGEVSFD